MDTTWGTFGVVVMSVGSCVSALLALATAVGWIKTKRQTLKARVLTTVMFAYLSVLAAGFIPLYSGADVGVTYGAALAIGMGCFMLLMVAVRPSVMTRYDRVRSKFISSVMFVAGLAFVGIGVYMLL